MAIPQTLGERIKAALEEAKMTQGQLAKRLGVSRPWLSAKINSDNIDEEQVLAIGEVVGKSPAYLRYGVAGTFEDGARWALARIREAADQLEGRSSVRRVAEEWPRDFGREVQRTAKEVQRAALEQEQLEERRANE